MVRVSNGASVFTEYRQQVSTRQLCGGLSVFVFSSLSRLRLMLVSEFDFSTASCQVSLMMHSRRRDMRTMGGLTS